MKPVVRVVGLGPGPEDLVTERTRALVTTAAVVRLRTRRHPSAERYGELASYDDRYDHAESFESLYHEVVEDLVALAVASPTGEVLYVVPGSPSVAERTVELLAARDDVTLVIEAAVSVLDVICARLGRDALAERVRLVDALGPAETFRGGDALLVLQTYAAPVLAQLAERLDPSRRATLVHHVGLDDEVVREMRVGELGTFAEADHLTSVWVEGARDAGEAANDLVVLAKRLREECPWDAEQTHESLTPYLLEEAYEAIDALKVLANGDNEVDVAHVQEELGDLLFHIVFHAELGSETGSFDFVSIADSLRDKLVYRHPHVFADVDVADAAEVAERWEMLKRREHGRESALDGVAWQLPALTLYAKLARKAASVGLEPGDELEGSDEWPENGDAARWGASLARAVARAQASGVDLEGALRSHALELAGAIEAREQRDVAERDDRVGADEESP